MITILKDFICLKPYTTYLNYFQVSETSRWEGWKINSINFWPIIDLELTLKFSLPFWRSKIWRTFLFQYSVSIGSILLVELISAVITFVYRHSLSQALKEGIFLSMEKYGMNTDISQAIDLLQAQVQL